jgi:hypothetical protein
MIALMMIALRFETPMTHRLWAILNQRIYIQQINAASMLAEFKPGRGKSNTTSCCAFKLHKEVPEQVQPLLLHRT